MRCRFAPNDSPVFRRGFQRAARRHELWSRRNSGPLDETGRRVPRWRRPVESRVARADPTWGIVSRLNRCHQRELKIEGGEEPSRAVEERGGYHR